MEIALEPDRLTREEAARRALAVLDVHYELHLDLEAGAKSYRGDCTARFVFDGSEPTFLDFTGSVIEQFSVNGIDREPAWHDNRIHLRPEWLEGTNEIRIRYLNDYDHSGEGFHQFIDPEDGGEYLYTQFEPFAAHRMFPCFDQPDLKATFDLAVTGPSDWVILGASRPAGEEAVADGRIRRVYEPTVPFSTYLLSVVAGPYRHHTTEHNGIPLGLYCRSTLIEHLDADELLALTTGGLDFFADFFGHPYPFTKYDQIFVPEFNWGGMENVGNVTYTDRYLFRDPPTDIQRLGRAETVLHELAHQWFGDLVTMKWWDDVWLNESFATYMAFLGLERATGFTDGWQEFQADMKLWAMEADQLPTTHRIADSVLSTDETFLNFDGITYGKGASALKQLVAAVGEDAFRDGMQAYFGRFAFGNATLADFLDVVGEGSATDLEAWSAAWLETPSVNTLGVEWSITGGDVAAMRVVQEAPADHPTIRPHVLDVAVLSDAHGTIRLESHRVRITGESEPIPTAAGRPAPVLAFPNYRDHTFAKVMLDPASQQFAEERIDEISDPLLRQQLWTTLWDMVRDRRLSSRRYLQMVEDKLVDESDLHIIKVVTDTAATAITYYVPETERIAAGSRFISIGSRALEAAPPGDARVQWLRAILRVAETPTDLVNVGRVVDGADVVPGLTIDQEMRWALAIRSSAAGLTDAPERAERELDRDPSDRGRRAMLTVATSVPDAAVKEQAWDRIHGDGYGSLHLDRSAMAGFNWAGQAELLEPYVGRFFAGLEGVFRTREHEAATAYFGKLFPAYRVDDETIGLARTVGAGLDGPPQLERLLIEAVDRQERALACRTYAGGDSRPA